MNYRGRKTYILLSVVMGSLGLHSSLVSQDQEISSGLVVKVYMKEQIVKIYKPEDFLTSAIEKKSIEGEKMTSGLNRHCPIYWEYSPESERFLHDLHIDQTDKVIEALVNNSSALNNYKIIQSVMEHYKDYEDTPQTRAEFESIVQAYFSSSVVIESRDFYLFNLIYDMALKLAYSINFKMMADIMFKYAGSLNQQNQYGETPAHVFVKNAALSAGHFFEVLHLFQQHGANFTEIKDFAQKSVYDYIIERTVEYLMGDGFAKEMTIFLVKEYLKSQGFNFN